VLCVTSGGVIGMMVRHLLDLDPARMAHLLVPIRNSSIHRVAVLAQGTILSGSTRRRISTRPTASTPARNTEEPRDDASLGPRRGTAARGAGRA
jgi:broad specificity phosphatase PhoE